MQAIERSATMRYARARAAALVSRVAVVLAAVVGTTIVLASPASALGFSTSTGTPNNTWAASTYFDCTNAVGPSPGLGSLFAYPLAETTGSFMTDVSGNNRGGAFSSTVTFGAAGPCATDGGRAAGFNGSNAYGISNAPITTPTTGSISVWFRTTVSGGKLLGYQATDGSFDRMLYLSDTGFVVMATGSTGYDTVRSSATYLDNQWHLATGTFAASGNANPGLRLYVDGVLVDSNPSAAPPAYTYAGYVVVGGGWLNGWPYEPTRNYFTGGLAYASGYGSALTPTQVSAMYQSIGGKPPGTLANTKIEAETLIGTAGGTAGAARVQNQCCSKPWSNGQQLEFPSMNNGQYGTLTFSVASAGTYAFNIRWSLYPDYGIHTVALDNVTVGPAFDNYDANGTTGSCSYGNVYLSAGSHVMKILATGKNASSTYYDVGLDFFTLQQISYT